MKRFATSLLVLAVAVTTADAQHETPLSRGFIPPYFSIPPKDAVVRFTSAVQPDFALPEFPPELLKSGQEGTTEVRIYVTSEGDAVYAEVTVSSGERQFDDAALKSAMRSHFPRGYATVDGIPHDFTIAIPYYFLQSADPEQYWQTRLELARVMQDYESLMTEFQNYLSERTVATKSRKDETRAKIEAKVAVAKKLHRMLAEKKETAILRLRDEISATRDQIDSMRMAATTERTLPWRQANGANDRPGTRVVPTRSGVVVSTALTHNDLDRLNQELELKKSYL